MLQWPLILAKVQPHQRVQVTKLSSGTFKTFYRRPEPRIPRKISEDRKILSPDIAPSDFHLFPELKKHLGGTQFQDDNEFEEAVLSFLRGQAAEFFDSGFHK
ncbi:hypothetical protein LAZ67_7000001 [Cordylochernes scorpioides]|uniref:Uncharacterized protein n=1 Tax=Cordylochernes scorpioides TaxID=51811 RepID=A0ABY6KL79_9ARAC|nr:hypothetical protein LAZ67_7000001 [Cordylochernes scorpioides]